LSNFSKGVLSAVVAQVLWGLFPIYWKWLSHVTPLEVLSHRNLWCAVFLLLVILLSAERRQVVAEVLANRFEILRHLFSAALIANNWLVYIWAVVNDHVVDASLGYFLSPLVSVALGYFVFAEKLNARQWSAIALAVFGVLIMVIASGEIPWIGISLATTFGLYGMVRKKAPTGPINGLFIETLLLVPVTLMAFLWIEQAQGLHYSNPFGKTELLLILGGLVTAVPLILYAQGARTLPLSLSGLLVYLTPSIQFLIGWLYYRESIQMTTWAGFICIWLALFIYSLSIRKKPANSEVA